MIKTITFAHMQEEFQGAMDKAETDMDNWLESEMLPRKRLISTHTALSQCRDNDNVVWTTFAITVVYETL